MVKGFTSRLHKFRSNLHLARTLRLIWSVTRGGASFTVALIMIESALFLGALYVFRLLVDAMARPAISTEEKSALVIKYLLMAGGATVLYVLVRAITAWITELQATKISEHIDDKIHACAVKLDLAFYESPAYFDTMKRARDAGPERPNAILTNLVDITKNGMMLLVMGSVLISISWLLLPLMALFILPTLMVRVSFADKMYKWRREHTPLERKSSYLSTIITSDVHAKEVKAFGLGNYLRTTYRSIRRQIQDEKLRLTKRTTVNEIITTVLATLGLFCCIGFICISTVKGNTTVGDVTLFLVIFPQLFNLLNALSSGISNLYQNNIFVSNLYELLDLKPVLEEPAQPAAIPQKRDVTLAIEGVSFTYPHARDATLSNISLQLPAGKIVAVVGLNGAGKTTLIKLLSRLYDPSAGKITMGGIDIRQFRSEEFKKQVSVVFQDFGRYNLTAADNIRFGDIDGNRPEDDIREAAMQSGAHDFIRKFPKGYDTTMGRVFEEGREVSIGQWQKLAIARAFYSNSRFIILDEATSALDAKAEQELFESFREKIGQRGVLIISHRLSAVKHADHIYVMSDGKITQHGTHEELVSMPGEYAHLFTKKPVII
ncbi:MAG TPA: ABC transporter ATP-binding protein [Chitinophagaceae bacterium]|nr:ABC transporter ATP-binding protein [Chitinophagaceae bacterium]